MTEARAPGDKHDESTVATVVSFGKQGLEPVDIAKTTGVPVRTVRDMLDRAGIATRDPAPESGGTIDKIIEEHGGAAIQKGFEAASNIAERITESKDADEIKALGDAYQRIMSGAIKSAEELKQKVGVGAPPQVALEVEDGWIVEMPDVDPDDDHSIDAAAEMEEGGDMTSGELTTNQRILATHAQRAAQVGAEHVAGIAAQVIGPPPPVTSGQAHRDAIAGPPVAPSQPPHEPSDGDQEFYEDYAED